MISDATYVETAGQTIAIPGDMPTWATPELVAEAAATLPPTDSVTQGPNGALVLVDTPYGAVYFAPGAPDWVNANAVAQAKAAFESGNPTPPPPPPTPVEPSPTGVITTVTDAGGDILKRTGQFIFGAAGAVQGVATGVADTVASITAKLIPTIQELAIGLTSRFADLASNIAAKTIDFGTYSFQLAVDAANAMGGVLDEAWTWIYDALASLMRLLSMPLEALYNTIVGERLSPAI